MKNASKMKQSHWEVWILALERNANKDSSPHSEYFFFQKKEFNKVEQPSFNIFHIPCLNYKLTV